MKNLELITTVPLANVIKESYSDLDEPRDIRVRKISSEVPQTIPTAIIAG